MRQLPLGVRILDRAVFASFLPARNREVVEHLQRMAAGELSGTVWLCGPSGSGKSHLLQAVCAAAGPAVRTGYLPLGAVAELGPGVLEGLPRECLCLDDIHCVAGQRDWERALFGVLREVQECDGRLLMAATAPPALITWGLPDLASRFAASAIFQLRALDDTEQQAALQLRARVRGFELPDETSRWLQRHFPRDIARLCELLDTLDEAALAAQRRLTVPFIREVLGR